MKTKFITNIVDDDMPYFNSIALEAQALEDIFAQAKNDYHNTPTLMGKKWYSIGLESNDSEQQKDSGNKNGVIRRMITAIVNFIKRIIEKIKSFFNKEEGEKAKRSEEFARTYKGPQDDDLAAAVNEFVRTEAASQDYVKKATDDLNAKHDSIKKNNEDFDRAYKKSQDTIKANREKLTKLRDELKNMKATDEDLDAALDRLREVGTGRADRAAAQKIFEDAAVPKVVKSLGEKRVALMFTTLRKDFHSDFIEARKLFLEITTGSSANIEDIDKKAELAEELAELRKKCLAAIENESASEEEKIKPVADWIMLRSTQPGSTTRTYLTLAYSEVFSVAYMQSLSKLVEKLENESSEEAVEKLKKAQKLSAELAAFSGLSAQIIVNARAVSDAIQEVVKERVGKK